MGPLLQSPGPKLARKAPGVEAKIHPSLFLSSASQKVFVGREYALRIRNLLERERETEKRGKEGLS